MTDRIYLPALRGAVGDWIYYASLMTFAQVAERVNYAGEIHQHNDKLSELLQRSLRAGRGKEIAHYLTTQQSRFFNALVLAVYGGDPEWHEFGRITPQRHDIKIEDIPQIARESIGFLSLTGKEKLFALDGQHRLAGIRIACKDLKTLKDEQVAVILVAHKTTVKGLERTRRLFTTLNKRAKSVTKGEIISLDEDDAMAICVRRLVEENAYFVGDRICYSPGPNIPVGNFKCLTTIGNLYDTLKTLFTRVNSDVRKKPDEVLYYRLEDDVQNELYKFACDFFELLGESIKPLRRFFTSRSFGDIVARHRGDFGGNVFFRPLGWNVMVSVIVALSKAYTLEECVSLVSLLPQDLTGPPFDGLLWDTSRKAMKKPPAQALCRHLLLYMLEEEELTQKIKGDYAVAVGDPGNLSLAEQNISRIRR